MTEQRSSYRQIFKATSLFGGVQVFNILIGIVRVKFVAVLLGTAGVGIIGLLNAPLELIVSITGLGIYLSAVRDISAADGTDNPSALARAIVILRRWAWITGLLGAVVTVSLAPMLSQWSFGNKEYTWAFVWLGLTIILGSISHGQTAVLQGTRRLRALAQASVIGSALGLITSIPLYYWFGTEGIVPAMVISAVTALLISWYYVRKVKIEPVDMSFKKTITSGLGMVKLGISMTIAGLIASLSRYVLNAYISNNGGVEVVGLYNAGWGVISQYTAVVFAAMATDYFPRLSAIHSDNNKVQELVRQQSETAVLILTPLLALLIVMMPLVIRVLYTKEFMPMLMFANLTILGIHFKTLSWAMGYIYLAKSDGRLFLILEIISGSIILGLNLLCYHFYGLNGLGVSFIISYVIAILISFFILKWKYQITFPPLLYARMIFTYSFVLVAFATSFIETELYRYIAGSVVLALATVYSVYKLNQFMDLKSIIVNKIKSKLS